MLDSPKIGVKLQLKCDLVHAKRIYAGRTGGLFQLRSFSNGCNQQRQHQPRVCALRSAANVQLSAYDAGPLAQAVKALATRAMARGFYLKTTTVVGNVDHHLRRGIHDTDAECLCLGVL